MSYIDETVIEFKAHIDQAAKNEESPNKRIRGLYLELRKRQMMLTKAVESGEVTEAIYIEKLKAQKEKDTQMLSYF